MTGDEMIGPTSRVLVVDDFELVRAMLRRTLAEMGITQVEEAVDGQNAEEMMVKAAQGGAPYNVIFCDWNMPRKSGVELLSSIRTMPAYQATPFVMVTAEAERDYVIQALAAGATDYIIKPVSGESLKRKIDSINRRLQKAG